ILPAEYGVDPTGVGHALGLKKMGEIKKSLEKEALTEPEILKDNLTKNQKVKSEIFEEKQDIMEVEIASGEAIEIKLEMKKGTVVKYQWTTINGGLNFDLHGDGYKGTHKSATYKKGKMVASDKGELVAEFDGYHGWFWRNRNDATVKVLLEVTGDFIQMKRVL
ncbi:MAG: transmembrane anchor protein, partial [Candidatus Marinimicrobia bacterium]|nr:transmembrane anchor protein [Candidatus Neomarinimicrobiota bacterium]MBT6517490.1 transmembrane anchor protein [Candidatus Neomarinimicrobiota bacterium]